MRQSKTEKWKIIKLCLRHWVLGSFHKWHLQNCQIIRPPAPLSAFGTDLLYKIYATSTTMSAFPWPPPSSDADIISGGSPIERGRVHPKSVASHFWIGSLAEIAAVTGSTGVSVREMALRSTNVCTAVVVSWDRTARAPGAEDDFRPETKRSFGGLRAAEWMPYQWQLYRR